MTLRAPLGTLTLGTLHDPGFAAGNKIGVLARAARCLHARACICFWRCLLVSFSYAVIIEKKKSVSLSF